MPRFFNFRHAAIAAACLAAASGAFAQTGITVAQPADIRSTNPGVNRDNTTDGSTTIGQDARLWASLLVPGAAQDYVLGAGRLAYVHVVSGRLAVNGVALAAGDGAKIATESDLHFMATDEAEILLFDLPPAH